jgi:hypothetical protein
MASIHRGGLSLTAIELCFTIAQQVKLLIKYQVKNFHKQTMQGQKL